MNPTPTGPPALLMQGVNFSYGHNLILKDVHLTLLQGDFLAVLGPNGGGKTTLIKLALGLLKPDSGRVEVFGRPPGQAAQRVGYVPQHVSAGPGFPVTVLDAAIMGFAGHGLCRPKPSEKEKKRALEVLERVDMKKHALRRMDSLSGGQIQRVLVARALVSRPDLLIFDEPTANIDPRGRHCIYEMLDSIATNITILVVSHDLIVASSRLTCVAAVNQNLIFSRHPVLDERMLALIYGEHHHSCPMDGALQGMQHIIAQRMPPGKQP